MPCVLNVVPVEILGAADAVPVFAMISAILLVVLIVPATGAALAALALRILTRECAMFIFPTTLRGETRASETHSPVLRPKKAVPIVSFVGESDWSFVSFYIHPRGLFFGNDHLDTGGVELARDSRLRMLIADD